MRPPLFAIPDAAPEQGRRLLVVDGDAARSSALKRGLRDCGAVACTAVADVARTRALGPHLVLAAFDAVADEDLEFVRALARMDDAPPTLVLVLVEPAAKKQRIQALHAGAADCFAWPIEPAELVARVDMHVRHAERIRALWAASYRDSLTGLLNRRGLIDVLRREVASATRRHHPLALLVVDLNGFKRVNDLNGHNVGDEILRHLAVLLARCVRANDVVARLGGDEFVVVLPGRDAAGARALAQRLKVRLERATRHSQLGASVGVAELQCRIEGESAEALLGRAELVMYVRKRSRSSP